MAFSSQSFTAPKMGKGNMSSPLSFGASKLRVNRINFGNKRIISSPALEAQSSIENTLSETNAILVEIQKQLSLDFSMRIADEKEKNKTFKEEKSRKKLISKESSIESIKKIGGAIKKTAAVVAAPVSGFFDKILEFITTLGLGIGANAVLTWFEDEENRRKIGTFFKIVTANWKLLRNILGLFVAAGLALKVANAILIIGKAISLLASPPALLVIAGLSAGAKFIKDTGDTSNRLLEEGGIDPEKAKVVGSEENKKATEILTEQASNPLMGGMYIPTLVQQQLGPDGEPKPRIGKKVTSKFDVPLFAPIFQFLDQEGYKKFLEDKKQKLETEEKPEQRKMGGPVIAGRPYIVGDEKGLETAEIFVPRIDGTIINNKRTQTILNGSKNKGKVNFLTMDLPPIQMNKGKPGPTPPAPEVPQISSTNSADLWRMKTPEIYGIYV